MHSGLVITATVVLISEWWICLEDEKKATQLIALIILSLTWAACDSYVGYKYTVTGFDKTVFAVHPSIKQEKQFMWENCTYLSKLLQHQALNYK